MSANRSSTETEIMTGQTITAEDEDQHITGFGSFPSDWKKASISECANIRDSERIPLNSTERTEKKPGEIPYYGANGVVDYIDDYLFDSELILLAEDGGHFDEYQSRPIAYRVSGKAWVNNHAHVLEAVEEVDTEYLFYSLEHRNLVPYVSGSTRSKLTKSMLQKVKVPLPPLAEQRKVASVLATVDAAIQKTEAIIEQADRVKRGLMQDILQHGLSGEALKEDPEGRFGKIPESWRVKRLSDVTDVVGGSTPDTNEPKYWGGTIRWATPSDITKLNHVTIADTARTITDEGLNSTSTHVLPP
jgi:type I restriction enzyme S subunit